MSVIAKGQLRFPQRRTRPQPRIVRLQGGHACRLPCPRSERVVRLALSAHRRDVVPLHVWVEPGKPRCVASANHPKARAGKRPRSQSGSVRLPLITALEDENLGSRMSFNRLIIHVRVMYGETASGARVFVDVIPLRSLDEQREWHGRPRAHIPIADRDCPPCSTDVGSL
jgi:hypothetical protein